VVTNYVGAVSSGLAVADHLRRQGHGTLVVLSSVAGERVRPENFVYGSTKAGLDAFAQGLGDSLVGSGASVHGGPPGIRAHQAMTTHLDRRTHGHHPRGGGRRHREPASASGAHTVWSPAKLRYVFAVLRHLPRPVWRRVAASK
jgi:decaprenylphospho-beta-D-erythro-pentofuranosid-2-ulose 2-reductase